MTTRYCFIKTKSKTSNQMDRHIRQKSSDQQVVRKPSPPEPASHQISEMKSSEKQQSDYEAIFDSGYSAGLPSSSNVEYSVINPPSSKSSSSSSRQHLDFKGKESLKEVSTSDSGLCLDSTTSSSIQLDNQEDESSQTTALDSKPSLPRGIDLDAIGSEALFPNSDGNSLLHLSIEKGMIDLSLNLIQKALHPDLLDIRNGYGQTPIHLASQLGQSTVVRRLLVSGATIDLKNFDGETALHIACFQGDLETVKAILKPISPTEVIEANLDHYMPQIHGSNMITLMHDMNYEGQTCLHLASSTGNRRLFEYLKSMGGNFNIREGKSGWTCLHHAIASFRTDVVHILTTVIRVDVNVRSYSGKTALESAASYSRRLQASNSTALSAAIRSIVILLIEAGANKHDFNCLSSEDESDSDSDTYFSEEEREE